MRPTARAKVGVVEKNGSLGLAWTEMWVFHPP
jgi:hypothetical protein